jgi:hypothetical protein
MAFDQLLALRKRAGLLDLVTKVFDAVDQVPMMVILTFHP